MSDIKVNRSGFISFVLGSSTIFTGLIFTLIITRTLTQEEFGTWAVIGTLLGYVLILSPVISYWNTREVARGEKTGKTALSMGGVFASIAFLAYIIIAFFYSEGVVIDKNIILFASILVPLEFTRSILVGITNGYKPQLEELGKIIFEISKIGLAIGMLYYLEMGIFGLILTSFFATFSNVIYLIFASRKILKSKFNKELISKWLKLFWIPLFPNLPVVILSTEIIIFSIFSGGVSGVAYWSASFTVGRLVRNSRLIAKAVYPKILQGSSKQVFETNFTNVLFFAFPLAGISLVFAKAGLFALNPIYEIAFPIVFFIVPTIFLRTVTEVFGGVLQGFEKVDLKKDAKFIDYLKSKLIIIPTLKIIHRISYLIILIVVLFLLTQNNYEIIEIVKFWAITALITQIPLTVYVFRLLHKEIKPKFESKIIIKYFLTTVIVSVVMFIITESYLEYNENIFNFLPNLITYVIIYGISYFGLTYLIDYKTRKLMRAILREITGNSK